MILGEKKGKVVYREGMAGKDLLPCSLPLSFSFFLSLSLFHLFSFSFIVLFTFLSVFFSICFMSHCLSVNIYFILFIFLSFSLLYFIPSFLFLFFTVPFSL